MVDLPWRASWKNFSIREDVTDGERVAWCVTHKGYELLQTQLESFTDQMRLALKDAGSITPDWAKMAAVTST